MFEKAANLYRASAKRLPFLFPVLLLLIRLSFGWDIYTSGHAHLNDVAGMTKKFEQWQVPHPRQSVYISAYTELFGGLILMAGIATRLVTIPLIFNFATAIATAGRENVVNLFKQDFSNIVDDAAFPYLIICLIFFVIGPGVFSIDGLLARTVFKKYAAGLK
jgi:putative oxidoreductase